MPLFFHPSIHDHLSLPVVVRHRPHGRLEVGRGLLLDLVGERVDLEAVEARDKLVCRSLWPEQKQMQCRGQEVSKIGTKSRISCPCLSHSNGNSF